jgi:hypothetical protein
MIRRRHFGGTDQHLERDQNSTSALGLMTGKGPQSHDGVHREMLQEVFGANTGLYTTLQASA